LPPAPWSDNAHFRRSSISIGQWSTESVLCNSEHRGFVAWDSAKTDKPALWIRLRSPWLAITIYAAPRTTRKPTFGGACPVGHWQSVRPLATYAIATYQKRSPALLRQPGFSVQSAVQPKLTSAFRLSLLCLPLKTQVRCQTRGRSSGRSLEDHFRRMPVRLEETGGIWLPLS